TPMQATSCRCRAFPCEKAAPIRRRTRRIGLLALALAAFCLPVLAREPHYEINFDKPTPDWPEGPVRYITTKGQHKQYKVLTTKHERADFIDIFWKRRDPTPNTEINEFKERFRQRTLDADQVYSETTTPGWKTDMGKVFILIGPPDEMVR